MAANDNYRMSKAAHEAHRGGVDSFYLRWHFLQSITLSYKNNSGLCM